MSNNKTDLRLEKDICQLHKTPSLQLIIQHFVHLTEKQLINYLGALLITPRSRSNTDQH